MRILLVPPKYNYPDPRPSRDIFGLGLPYLAGALKKAGHDVFGVDINYRWCGGSAPLDLDISLRRAIEDFEPHFVGIGGLSADYKFVRDAIKMIRRISPDLPILCGGGIITYEPEFTFPNLRPDFAIGGDAEAAIVKLADTLEKNLDFGAVPSLAYWKDGEAVYNRVEYPATSLDELAFPEHDIIDIKSYYRIVNQSDNFIYSHTRNRPRIMGVALGRSCPYKCTFCCHAGGAPYRMRSIDSGLQEIAYLYEKYRFNVLFIYDELFSLKKGRILEFCSKLRVLKKELKMDFDWTCALKADSVDPGMLREMKDAGCIFIGYGLESASPTVLKSMKKGVRVEEIARTIKMTTEARIGAQGNFIFGDIAETPETIRETKDFIDKNCADIMLGLGYVTPYPGSEIYQYCLANGLITDKLEYYERLSRFDQKSVNMTKMSGDQLYNLVDPILLSRDLKRAVPHFSEKRNFSFDPDAPFSLRRAAYRIKIICPHCEKEVDYLCAILIKKGETPSPQPQVCAVCHKYFEIGFSGLNLENEEPEPSEYSGISDERISRVLLDFCIPVLVGSYKEYNFVEYKGTLYSLDQALGPINISQIAEGKYAEYEAVNRIIVKNSYEESKRIIDQIRSS